MVVLVGLPVTTGGVVCLAASTVAGSITTSEQAFQIAGSPVTVAGQVLAAKLPLPANSKIVTLNMPTTQGGREHENDIHSCRFLAYVPKKLDGEVLCENVRLALKY